MKRLTFIAANSLERHNGNLVLNRYSSDPATITISYDSIDDVWAHKGMLYSQVYVQTTTKYEFVWVRKAEAEHFVRQVQRMLQRKRTAVADGGVSNGASSLSSAEQLQRLADLLEKGLIDRSEFEREKRKILEE